MGKKISFLSIYLNDFTLNPSKKFIQSTFIYGFFGFLPLASRLFLFPIFVKYLSTKDYGIIGLSNSMIYLFTILFAFGLNAAFSRYYFEYRTNTKLLNAFITTIVLSIVGITVLFCLIGVWAGPEIFRWVFRGTSFSFYPYGFQACIISFVQIITLLISTFYRDQENLTKYSIVALGVFSFSTLFETYAILVLGANAEKVLWARALGISLFSIPYWIYFFYNIPIRYDFRFIKTAFKYCGPIVPYSILIYLYINLDRIYIAKFLSIEAVGIYSVAITIASIIDIVIEVVNNALSPALYRRLKSEPMEGIIESANGFFNVLGLITLFTSSVLLLGSTFLLHHLVPPNYNQAIEIIPLLLIGFTARYFFRVFLTPAFLFKKTKKIPLINLTAVIVLSLSSYYFIPNYGLTGAAISLILTRFSLLPITLIIEKNDTNFNFKILHQYFANAVLIVCCLLTYFSTGFSRQCFALLPFLYFIFYLIFLLTSKKGQKLTKQMMIQ